MKIAYLASRVTLPGSPTRRPDAHEHDQTIDALAPALAQRGMVLEDLSWDTPCVDWASFGAAIIGTTWDYWDRHGEFLTRLREIEAATRLFNPAGLVAWNSHKSYLRELEAKGAKLIATLWVEVADEAAISRAFDELETDDIVVKRQVGAGAFGQHRLKRGEPVPHMPHPMMIQPFLEAIQREGEISFVMVDGALSHALVKRAKPGDYRIQSSYGGVETPYEPDAADLAAARAIIETLDAPPLYARVDMLRGEDGGLYLMELELIEPFLYPLQGPGLGEAFAAALEKRI